MESEENDVRPRYFEYYFGWVQAKKPDYVRLKYSTGAAAVPYRVTGVAGADQFRVAQLTEFAGHLAATGESA
jgi:hypothetical protein